MTASASVILYHAPPSFYSQIARIALAEKGVTWRSRIIAAGPPIFESYRRWYMKLNPGGTVPTMVHDGKAVPDSFLIADYVERYFDGPSLMPSDPQARQEAERWVAALKNIPVRELCYGAENIRKIGAPMNRMRIRSLRRFARKYPEMAATYREKERDIQGFSDNAVDPVHYAAVRDEVVRRLDEMENVLKDRRWLAGEQYSLADAMWTVAIGRFTAIGMEPLDGRPSMARWYEENKRRPSFAAADIWDRISARKILSMLLSKMWPHLLVISVAAVVLGVGFGWLL